MRYEYIEDREEEYQQPKQRTQSTRVVPSARPTRTRPEPIEPNYAPKKNQGTINQRAYSSAMVGGMRVRVINMRVVLGNVMVGLVVLVCMALAVVIWQHLWFNWMMPRYTYKAYREQIHSTVPACNMDGSLRGESQSGGMIILCAETGKVPTKEQINQWQGYTLWNACYEFGDDIACQQLND